MPYRLQGTCVQVKRSSGWETLKCYDDAASAKKYLAALEANVSEAKETKAFQGALEQSEVAYIPLSTVKGKACANCRWFLNNGCFIVESYEPEPIIATGYCNRWEATPPPKPELEDVLVEAVSEVVDNIATAISDAMPTPPMTEMDMGKAKKPGLMDKIRALVNPPKPVTDDAFTIFKGLDNEWHWHAIFTNNYEDLEGEILTEKAHDKYIMRLDMGLVPMPELWAWHVPGSKHGEADVVWRNEHFVHAIGHFDNTPIAQKAIEFYRKNAGKIKMSHGFTTPEWAFDGKHYKDYNTIEITTLPPHAAANPYTSFEELKTMTWSDEKRRYVEALAGKDKAAEIEAADEERSKALDKLKVEFKDFAEVDPKAEKPVAEQPVNKAYLDLVEAQNEMFKALTLVSKALTAKDAEIKALADKHETETKAWMKELNDLRTLVNQPPRRASQDSATVVKDDEKLKSALPDGNPADSFWSSMGVTLKAGG